MRDSQTGREQKNGTSRTQHAVRPFLYDMINIWDIAKKNMKKLLASL